MDDPKLSQDTKQMQLTDNIFVFLVTQYTVCKNYTYYMHMHYVQ